MKFLYLLTIILCFAITTKIILRKIDTLKVNQIDFKDCSPPKFYITGDKHRNFKQVSLFCQQMNTRRNDVLIILGDTGLNFFGDKRDDKLKEKVSKLPITLFCIHGNKENRPENVGTYGIKNFYGAKVYYEPEYSNILFAIDGETYNFGGRKYIVIGGAHSVDKLYCLEHGKEYWDDEMPSEEIKQKVELKLSQQNNKIYGVLTHTCPIKYLPNEVLISTRNKKKKSKIFKINKKSFKPDIDRSTEVWLDKIEKEVEYTEWFCGHYHVDKNIDNVHMLYKSFRPLCYKGRCNKNNFK